MISHKMFKYTNGDFHQIESYSNDVFTQTSIIKHDVYYNDGYIFSVFFISNGKHYEVKYSFPSNCDEVDTLCDELSNMMLSNSSRVEYDYDMILNFTIGLTSEYFNGYDNSVLMRYNSLMIGRESSTLGF